MKIISNTAAAKIKNILVLAGSRGTSMMSFTITNSCSMQCSDFREQICQED